MAEKMKNIQLEVNQTPNSGSASAGNTDIDPTSDMCPVDAAEDRNGLAGELEKEKVVVGEMQQVERRVEGIEEGEQAVRGLLSSLRLSQYANIMIDEVPHSLTHL